MTRPWPILAALALTCLSTPAPAQRPALPVRLEALAAQGNAEALYHLGMIHHLGLEGMARDPWRAFDYFRQAADAGDPLGAYKVGCFYAGQGEGVVAENAELALRYKLIAAEAGYTLAQVDVARIFAQREDWDQALRWYEAAARQGDAMGLTLAFSQVMPGGERPDNVRAWLYLRVLDRGMQQVVARLSEADARQMRDELAPVRQAIEADLSESQRAEAERLLSEWVVSRSLVSLRADQGLSAARRLAGLAAEQ